MKKYKKWIAMGVIGFLIFLGFFTGYILQKQKSSTPLSLIYIPKTEDGTSDFWSSLISGARWLPVNMESAESGGTEKNRMLKARSVFLKKQSNKIRMGSFFLHPVTAQPIKI